MEKIIKGFESSLDEKTIKSLKSSELSLLEFLRLPQLKKECYYVYVASKFNSKKQFNGRIWEMVLQKAINERDAQIALKHGKSMLIPFCNGLIKKLEDSNSEEEKTFNLKLIASEYFTQKGMTKQRTNPLGERTIEEVVSLKKEGLLGIKGIGIKIIDSMNDILKKDGYVID